VAEPKPADDGLGYLASEIGSSSRFYDNKEEK